MEPIMLFVIAAIIAAIVLVAFNKQQENKTSNYLYTDDVKQLYQLTTAEYKITALENQQQFNEANHVTDAKTSNIAQELDVLTAAYENGEIPLNELNSKLDYLLNEFNINNASMVEAY